MEIQDWVKQGAIGAVGGMAGAALVGTPLGAGIVIGISVNTVSWVALAALESFSGAISWLAERAGQDFAFVSTVVTLNTAAVCLISQVVGLSFGLIGSLFPVLGALGLFMGVEYAGAREAKHPV